MDLTICIGTFGGQEWAQLAEARAIPSARALGIPVIHRHDETLAKARNAAIEAAETEWVVVLDADDELDPGFAVALAAHERDGDLLGPAVSYVRRGVAGSPKLWPAQDLADGNHLVVGTAVRRAMVLSVGGFRDWPLYEDWCLWQRCVRAGATIAMVPDAVYIAHVIPESRNRAPSQAEKLHWHHEIRRANYPELYDEAAA